MTTNLLSPVFSVSEIHEVINSHLSLLGPVQVDGEISDIKLNQNKWLFITLKDNNAVLSVFAVAYQISNFRSLEVGMQVSVYGSLRTYAKYGRLSLQATSITPNGLGSLQIAYDRLKRMLETEGVFDPSHKRTLPAIPQHIGLLTGADSQAEKDFVKVATNRLPSVKIQLLPVQVQGRDAAQSIVTQIQAANKIESLDLLVLTRGGGSQEDLSAFNDEAVVRAVFGSSKIIVCAIGHEGDVSLAELAADLRASTPSNAAELCVPSIDHLVAKIDHLVTQAVHTCRLKHGAEQNRLNYLLGRQRKAWDLSTSKYQQILVSFSKLVESSKSLLVSHNSMLNQLNSKALIAIRNILALKLAKVEQLDSNLKLLDIHGILKRGFSITTNSSGRMISSSAQVRIGDQLQHRLYHGRIRSTVNKVG